MTPGSTPSGSSAGWIPIAAFCVVLGSLVALAVTPAVLLERITRATDEITMTGLPAYEAARNLSLAMEERVASSRSLFLTGDSLYAVRLERAEVVETVALAELEARAPRFGDTAVGHIAALRELMEHRDSVVAEIMASDEEREAFLAAVPAFEALRDSMLVTLVAFNRSLEGVTEARVAEEVRLARLQRTLSFGLGAVAVVAALLVGWFAWQQHRLRRQVQRSLEEANRQRAIAERHGEELHRAMEARVRLLRGVTHDVKNPLGAAKGYAELLQLEVKAPLLPEHRPFLDGIQRSVDGALGIIEDLLDLARADSGGLSVERVESDLASVAAAAAEDHRSAAEAAGHTLEIESPPEPLRIFTDPGRVAQVLGNLLSNAIKYAPPPGRIVVRTGTEGGDEEGRWATVRVSDDGPGIPPEQREVIFDEFTRLEDRGDQKGHGLGLAIARRIARLLGGDLNVEEGATGGASFVLRLPVRNE